MEDCEIAVSGAGSVGAALALGLARLGLGVTLIESRSRGVFGKDRRRFVLSELSAQWLGQIGVWNEMQGSLKPIHSIRVDEPGTRPVHFEAREIGLPTLGYAVDAAQLARAFERAIRSEPGIRLLEGARIRRMGPGEPRGSMEIESGSGTTAIPAPRLLVVAEGQVSSFLDEQGFNIRTRDSGQSALVIRLQGLTGVTQDRVSERLGPEGLLALLPESASEATLTWTLRRDRAETFLANPPAEQCLTLSRLLDLPAEGLGLIEAPTRFDLIRRHIDPPYREGILVIGQAAHSVAPFAAQGMNLAWRDARILVTRLSEARQAGCDFGSAEWLKGYWQGRRSDHRRVGQLTESLPRLFESRSPFVRRARRSGWQVVRTVPLLRRAILRFGLGWNP